MNLNEAYRIFTSTTDDATTEEVHQATVLVYEELRSNHSWVVKKLSSEEDAEDLIQDVFMDLSRKRTSLRPVDNARAALRDRLKKRSIDRLRQRKRSSEGLSRLSKQAADTPESPDEKFELKEASQHSNILASLTAKEEVLDALYGFLKEVVVPQQITRRPAQDAARLHIDEMREITTGTLSFDELIHQQIDRDTDEKELINLRNAIQKRHSRTRERLLHWLKHQGRGRIVEIPSTPDELTEIDHQLLLLAVDDLRSRSAAEKPDE